MNAAVSTRNNIGFLRLVFASLVVIGHAPEQIDIDRHREPLTRLLGTLSLGELAVDSFFLLSGYLITQSFERSTSVREYLIKRVLRIYPAFIIAFLASVFVLAPFTGGDWRANPGGTLLQLLTLREPGPFPGQFADRQFLPLNGAAWSIAYEARCYVLVLLLGVCGLLHSRKLVLGLTGIGLACSIAATFEVARWRLRGLGGDPLFNATFGLPILTVRMTPIFLVGMCFRLFRAEIEPWLNGKNALVAAVLAVVLMYHDPAFAEAGFVTLGGFALFWLAFRARLGPLQRINDEWDISYGTYLYGWPVSIGILLLYPAISPWLLGPTALLVAWACGAMSWWLVEKRAVAIRSVLATMLVSSSDPARQ